MPRMKLSLNALKDLDLGKASLAFTHLLRKVVDDINDRPGCRAKRIIKMDCFITPVLDKDSACLDTCDVQFIFDHKLPKLQSIEYSMIPTRDGALLFESLSPDDPRQPGLPGIDVPEAEVTEPAEK